MYCEECKQFIVQPKWEYAKTYEKRKYCSLSCSGSATNRRTGGARHPARIVIGKDANKAWEKFTGGTVYER